MSKKEDRYYIAVCEVTDKNGIILKIERLGNAWGYTMDLANSFGTPASGKLVKMRECSKEEWFSG